MRLHCQTTLSWHTKARCNATSPSDPTQPTRPCAEASPSVHEAAPRELRHRVGAKSLKRAGADREETDAITVLDHHQPSAFRHDHRRPELRLCRPDEAR